MDLVCRDHHRSSFQPAWWLRSANLQTLWPALFRWARTPALRRERFELPDGDFVDVDWTPGETGPIVLLLHGLEGSSRSPYIRGMLAAVNKRGWRGAAMHFRGCSGEPNRLPRTYHSGDTGDFACLLRKLRAREPDTPIGAVGFSLGGNALLKWLGEERESEIIGVAVSVCAPMVLSVCAERLAQGFSRLYQWRLIKQMKRKLAIKFAHHEPPIDLTDLASWCTFRAFDHHVTAPLHGFRDVDDYYARVSARQFLGDIQIPTLVIHAADDPFMTPSVIPTADELAPNIRLEISGAGGHVGFIGGWLPFWPSYWLEKRVTEFLAAHFQE